MGKKVETFDDVSLSAEELAALADVEDGADAADGGTGKTGGGEATAAATEGTAGKDPTVDPPANAEDETGDVDDDEDEGDDDDAGGDEAASGTDEAAGAAAASNSAAGADAAAAASVATATTADAAAATTATESEEIPLEDEVAGFTPRRELPADHKEQLTKLDADLTALEAEYDAGNINFKAFRERERAIVNQRSELESIAEEHAQVESLNKQAKAQRWQGAVSDFLKDEENARFRSKAGSAALNAALHQLYANPKYQGASYSYLLATARHNVLTELGLPTAQPAAAAAGAAAAGKGGKTKTSTTAERVRRAADNAAAARDALPKNLGDVPAAGSTDAGTDEFAHIDKLTGDDYEEAVASLNPKQYARYEASLSRRGS